MLPRFLCTVSLCIGLLSLAHVATAEGTALTRQEVNGLIRQFIEENPEVIVSSVTAYQTQKQIQDSLKLIKPHTPTHGATNAPVTIIEFSEFQCPFCRRVQPTLKELRKRYQGRINFAYKHLPLPFHPQAKPAALAAQAAHNQGKFWEYSDILWERQDFLGEKLYKEVAKELKLDMAQFNKDRASMALEKIMTQDLADGQSVGAQGTPYFLINGTPVSGALPLNAFVEKIEDALKAAE